MRVRDLIEELQKCDQEARVYLTAKGSIYDEDDNEHDASISVRLDRVRFSLNGPVLEGEQ